MPTQTQQLRDRFTILQMKRNHGFTLIELLVVIAVIAILASILLPTLAKAKARAQGTYCLNNARHLVLAWINYSDEHNDQLAFNFGVSAGFSVVNSSKMKLNWANNVLDWEAANPDNTNAVKLLETGLGPYLDQNATVYRCPSDTVLSGAQKNNRWSARVRSYSMNAMIGDTGSTSQKGLNEYNPDCVQFLKYNSIPQPGSIFVFLDEHPDTIRDGSFYLTNKVGALQWQRLPASYHDGAASFSFADGHVESHRWHSKNTMPSPEATSRAPIDISAKEASDYYWVLSRMTITRKAEHSNL